MTTATKTGPAKLADRIVQATIGRPGWDVYWYQNDEFLPFARYVGRNGFVTIKVHTETGTPRAAMYVGGEERLFAPKSARTAAKLREWAEKAAGPHYGRPRQYLLVPSSSRAFWVVREQATYVLSDEMVSPWYRDGAGLPHVYRDCDDLRDGVADERPGRLDTTDRDVCPTCLERWHDERGLEPPGDPDDDEDEGGLTREADQAR